MLNLNFRDLSGVSVSLLTVRLCTDSNYRVIADICSGSELSPKSFSQSFIPRGVAQSGNGGGGGTKRNKKPEYSLQLFIFPLSLNGNLSSGKEVQRMSDSNETLQKAS